MDEPRIPADLVIGTATASWQVEGDVAGRGASIWDDFAMVPGAIVDGTTGEPACEHLRRLDEDIDLICDLGFDAYRFSISWPRVQPGGRGEISQAGLDVYDRMVDRLLGRGIDPIVTLYHWDLPSELPGWTSRETPERFARYAGAVADRLADRVSRWATLNEPWVSAYLGYAAGIHAPGIRDPQSALSAAYHLMLAHGLGLRELRRAGARECGLVLNLIPVIPEDPAALAAARHVDGLHNRFFLDLLAGRGIPEDVVAATRGSCDWSFVREADLAVIAEPIDWLGENYYTVMRVAAAATEGAGFEAYPDSPPATFVPREPLTAMGWEVYPQGLEDALAMAASALPGVPLWVTENGAAYADPVEAGAVHDPERVDYFRRHLQALLCARAAGVDVRGYLAWSLLDNIEWAEGFTKRFGIVRVEPGTLDRIPKDSARWWKARLAERISP
jgi:beta-glucosidase